MQLNQTGSPLDRNERTKMNQNWNTIEKEFDNVVDTVSEQAYKQVVDAAKIEWLPPVNTLADIETTYPNATEGKTVMVRDSGKVYRKNKAAEWIEIQDIDPTVINEVDIRLTAQLKQREKEIISLRESKLTNPKTLELVAHRGFADLAPENTMTAFTVAAANGAYALECDIQLSFDGIPVLIHDETVDRTTNGTGIVSDMTLSELQSLDAGSKAFGTMFSSARIPTFEEFLRFARTQTNQIYPEIKKVRSLSDIQIIVDLIVEYGMEEKTILSSFTLSHLEEIRKYSSTINFGYLVNTEISESDLEILEVDGNCSLLMGYQGILNNPSLVQDCHYRGIEIGAWTPNNINSIVDLLNISVYKIITNRVFGGVYS